jgi:hypothetical protein
LSYPIIIRKDAKHIQAIILTIDNGIAYIVEYKPGPKEIEQITVRELSEDWSFMGFTTGG